jgi:hypothetical protein
MDDWLRWPRYKADPEAEWIVAIDPEAIRISDSEGRLTVVAKTELSGVAIKTEGTGPWGIDVWWGLFTTEEQPAALFPQGAIGEGAAVDYLMSLAGFDHEAMIEAMSCTENSIFAVWQKEAA